MKKIIFLSIVLFTINLNAQEPCYTTQYEAMLQKQFPERATTLEFENWIAPKANKYNDLYQNSSTFRGGARTIPVVFHIITDGSGVDNVSQSLVTAQLNQINIDFRNMAGSIHAVAADSQIEFCLAIQNPIGQNLTEPGINRVTTYGDGPFGFSEFQGFIKANTQWDPTKYLNIWVGPLTGTLLGYAQFPEAAGLPGIGTGNGQANTDGVVVTSRSVGSEANPNPNGGNTGVGRVLTHEIGHWLGLRHIWGDGPCGTDDFCADTPESDQSNFGCPTGHTSCGTTDMVENYMDYSDGTCMNTFTANQAARMNSVLDASPRRMELVTISNVCTPATVFNLDAGIQIENLNNTTCTNTIAPTIKLTNIGFNTLTSAEIEYRSDFNPVSTYNWSGSLLTNEFEIITLPSEALAGGFHTFSVNIINTNNTTDEFLDNNDVTTIFNIRSYSASSINLELNPDLFGSQITWTFTDNSGTVLYSGGPYTDNNTVTINETFSITPNDCYNFTINDTNGDGLCCSFGNGEYTLTTDSGGFIHTGSDFGSTETTRILVGTLSNEEFNTINNISIYPNPPNDILNIQATNNQIPDSYTIYSITGQTIVSKAINNIEDLAINTSNLSNGIYFMRVQKNNSFKDFKFVKQ